jgi:hypothetical protein
MARAVLRGGIAASSLWLASGLGPTLAQMSHDHHAAAAACAEPALACASKATPTFAPDGSLWLAWAAAGKVSVARSLDLGRSFSPPVAVTPEPRELDWGPDARPKLAVDRDGRVFVAFGVFKDKAFNGQVFYTRSLDSGRSFAPPVPITADQESQRFEAIALDADGSLFAAWLDKRNRVPAKARNESYVGAALAFAWANDHGAGVSDTRIAQDNTCLDPRTPGPIYRVSVDDWKTDVCPHQGPSLALSADGAYHVAWFTNGSIRKGLFYARSSDGGRSFSDPMPVGRADRNPSYPSLTAVNGAVYLAWKEFDGERTTVPVMISHDNGRTWSPPRVAADTSDASDQPLLATNGQRAFLSWQTRTEGYRLIPLEDAP